MVTSDAHQAIQVRQAVSIQVLEAGRQVRYRSMILDFTPEQEILIDFPAYRGQEIDLAPDTTLGMLIILPTGIWRYSVLVRERATLSRPALRCSWPVEAEKLQQRDHFRVGVALPAEVCFSAVAGDRPERSTIAGETADLSAGGVRIHLPSPIHLRTGAGIGVRLNLPDGAVNCKARVVRSGTYEGKPDEASFWIAAEFTDIPSAASRSITRFLFNASCQRGHSRGT